MLNVAYRNNRRIRGEVPASSHINLLAHYDDVTLIDRNDRLIRIIKLTGIDEVANDDVTLDIYKQRRNTLLKSFTSEFGFYFWEIKARVNYFPAGEFDCDYAGEVNDRYKNNTIESKMFHRKHYVAIVAKQPEGLINGSFSYFKSLFRRMDRAARDRYLQDRNKDLADATNKIISAFSDYCPELLGLYTDNKIKYSSLLEFSALLLNGDSHAVPLNINDANSVLPRKRLSFHGKRGVIMTESPEGKMRYSAILAIKGYQPFTSQGMFKSLSRLPIEYVLTQSYRPFDSQQAKSTLRDQQKDMLQSRDESISQAEQIDDAFDDAASGDVAYGVHHLNMQVYADSIDELNKNVGKAVSCFSDLDIACVRETVAAECSFWSQLPGNFGYILRPAVISTRNMAAFSSFHNTPLGKLIGNHWGEAVTVFETITGAPFYFNFHYRDVGNFLVFGAMGSGKTLLVGFLILESMKFGGKRIIYDKDGGLEILVAALDGTYETIKPGVKTGFNPCQLPDTSANRHFISQLLQKVLSVQGDALTASDLARIQQVVIGLFGMKPKDRRFANLASFFGVKQPGSLRDRFDQWHGNGAHAWLFDNAEDTLNFDANVIGFDIGHILNDPHCKTPALMYMTYRADQVLEGQRGMMFFDEGWRVLDDDYFKEFINDKSRTFRKLNNILGLATQVANDTSQSRVSKALNESSFCKFFFPSSIADRHIFVNELGLSEHEYQIIKTLPDDQYYFLHVLGQGVNRQSVVARINMDKMKDVIKVISANEASLRLFREIRARNGKARQCWLSEFLNAVE